MKIIDPEAFVEDGWLQEANRQFFHPRGVSLGVNADDGEKTAGWVVGFLDHCIEHSGFGHEERAKARSWVALIRKSMIVTLNDHRPEGIIFGMADSEEVSDTRQRKIEKMQKAVMRAEEPVSAVIYT